MLLSRLCCCLLSAAGAVTLSGCWSMYPYGMQPGAYPQQGGVAYPTPMAVPQSTFVMPGDVPAAGSSTQSAFAPSSQLQAPQPAAVPQQDQPVPAPRDPGQADAASPDMSQSFAPAAGRMAAVQPQDQEFAPPRVLTGVFGEADADPAHGDIVRTGLERPAAGDGPEAGMARDSRNGWFQGRVEFDEYDQAWHLIYDFSPAQTDQLGGEITLGTDAPLTDADQGQLVRVSGQFDTNRLDPLGKPVYRVTRVERAVSAVR